MAKKFLIIIITFFLAQKLNSAEIYGVPKIIDGDTVYINTKKIRLEGIDAPEIKQKCKKPFLKISAIIGFEFNKNYSCGVIAKKKLLNKIDNSKIKCISSSKDRYKRYSRDYVRDEAYAKENKLGVWKGSFMMPEKWRKLN